VNDSPKEKLEQHGCLQPKNGPSLWILREFEPGGFDKNQKRKELFFSKEQF
jgi:hypothetical protein